MVVLIMMNQKEIEALISIRKNLACSEEGSVKSSACPLLLRHVTWSTGTGCVIDPLTGKVM